MVVVAARTAAGRDLNMAMTDTSKAAGISMFWVPLVAAVAGLLLAVTPLGDWLSRPASDWQLRQLAPRQAPTDVVVFDIDDATLRTLHPLLGPWPFKRDIYALAVEALRELGCSVIAIDVLLVDTREGDQALARAMARPGAPVVLSAAGLRDLHRGPGMAEPGPAQAWSDMMLPAQSLWPAAGQPPRIGVVTTPLDADGLLRRLPLWHTWPGHRVPSFALAVWAAKQGITGAVPAEPAEARGRELIAFAGPQAAAPVLPFSQLAHVALGLEPPQALARMVKGKVVFVGSSALMADTVMTANGRLTGAAALAQGYTALNENRMLRPPATWAQALLLLLALVPSLWAWHRGQAALWQDGMAAAAALAAVVGVGLTLLWQQRMPTPWAPALATVLVGYTACVVARQRWLVRAHRQLAYARAVADAANLAKSEFLANVSHEIRTPMNALLGVAELLEGTPLNDEQRRHVQVFRESGRSLHELINDLLDLSRIEAGHFELDVAPFSLHALLARQLALLGPRAQAKGLSLTLQCATDLPDGVLGDGRRLQQALTNLVGNAIKFTPHGGVRIEAQCGQGADEIVIRVSDTGIGIVPAKLELIFEPFAQADGSVTRQFGGTGLGLSITRSLAHLMGGRIEVRSSPGEGSAFTLTLPMAQAALPQPPQQPEPEAAPLTAQPLALQSSLVPLDPSAAPVANPKRAVLLAEDNEVNVYIFEAMLAGQRVQIDVASDGPAALALATSRTYELIFMDLQMPGMDGLTVTRKLRQFETRMGRARAPVIALTANAYSHDVKQSLDAGCDMHLSKPFSRAQLLEALARFAFAESLPAPDAGGPAEVGTAPAAPDRSAR
jgi:signal transduction histidine kinase/ActR/RegA family two-component response regulator